MGLEVLLYVPNIIGYIRLILLIASWVVYYSHPLWSVTIYVISALLDAADGAVARKLKQTSAFGAWFDVVIDNLSRGMLWCRIFSFGYLVAAVEWITFVCNHAQGADWKASYVHAPWFVNAVMANNFRTTMGVATIAGLHVLPIWLYCYYHGVFEILNIPHIIQYLGFGILGAGRVLCMAVEMWCIQSHVLYLTSAPINTGSSSGSLKEKEKPHAS